MKDQSAGAYNIDDLRVLRRLWPQLDSAVKR
jgi:hypothetical protein